MVRATRCVPFQLAVAETGSAAGVREVRITLIRGEAGGHQSSDAEPHVYTSETGTMRSSHGQNPNRFRPAAKWTLYRGRSDRPTVLPNNDYAVEKFSHTDNEPMFVRSHPRSL